jgi:hypothetical protein
MDKNFVLPSGRNLCIRSPNVSVDEQDHSMIAKYSYENVLVKESTGEFLPVQKEILFKTDLKAPAKLG